MFWDAEVNLARKVAIWEVMAWRATCHSCGGSIEGEGSALTSQLQKMNILLGLLQAPIWPQEVSFDITATLISTIFYDWQYWSLCCINSSHNRYSFLNKFKIEIEKGNGYKQKSYFSKQVFYLSNIYCQSLSNIWTWFCRFFVSPQSYNGAWVWTKIKAPHLVQSWLASPLHENKPIKGSLPADF